MQWKAANTDEYAINHECGNDMYISTVLYFFTNLTENEV